MAFERERSICIGSRKRRRSEAKTDEFDSGALIMQRWMQKLIASKANVNEEETSKTKQFWLQSEAQLFDHGGRRWCEVFACLLARANTTICWAMSQVGARNSNQSSESDRTQALAPSVQWNVQAKRESNLSDWLWRHN